MGITKANAKTSKTKKLLAGIVVKDSALLGLFKKVRKP